MKDLSVPAAANVINREISWLAFNSRVLQEAADPSVPLIERLKFLGIFSSNLDEFFRVRVATMKRLMKLGAKAEPFIEYDPETTLNEIQRVVAQQQVRFEAVYTQLLAELEARHIVIVDQTELTEAEQAFVEAYYLENVRPSLIPLMVDQTPKLPPLHENVLYLAMSLDKEQGSRRITKYSLGATPPKKIVRYALAEVPTRELSRFVVLPSTAGQTHIVLLEDVVRFGLQRPCSIFKKFRYLVRGAFPIKITKDAELDITEDDMNESFVEKISKSVKRRIKGQPIRLTYDKAISGDLLHFLTKRLGLSKHDTVLPEGRYLNFKDFITFPKVGGADLQSPSVPPLSHKHIRSEQSLLKTIRRQDILLHYPYQSFHYMIDLLREAAIDPKVTSIRMTLYRVAEMSKITNALSKAAQNGKAVTVLFEFQARFDEEANISWANRLHEDGVRVIQGIPGLKVHAKLCLISRRERGKSVRYAAIGTGNFNENTARIYGDHTLFTADDRITNEVRSLFSFLRTNYRVNQYTHLVVSPFAMRETWLDLIDHEICNARAGKPAAIMLKMNNLVDQRMVEALYRASQAGVTIRLIVRGICSLVPGVPGLSDHIEAISIVDQYLEHSRIFVFHHDGKPRYYLSSADWMTRNLDHRVEVACPVYDDTLQQELQTYLDLQWRDNLKARMLNGELDNRYRPRDPSRPPIRSQEAIYEFLRGELE